MPNPNAVPARAIPTGILVSPRPKVCPAARPAPKRQNGPRGRARHVPWLCVVTGASVAWAAIVLTIGLCAEFREPAQPSEPRAADESIAMSAPAPKLAPQEPAVERKAPETEVAPEPIPIVPRRPESQRGEAPRLPFREVVLKRNDGMPPVLPVDREIVKTIERERTTPQVPRGEKAPARPAFNDLNPSVFASCTQVGTSVNLMKDPTEAFKKARAENKLVFMINLSGNLEDKEFT